MAKRIIKKTNSNSVKKPGAASKSPEKSSRDKKLEPAATFSTDVDSSLKELFIGELREIYWCENHLINAIPKLVAAAGAGDLKNALDKHLNVTKKHAARLEDAFNLLDEKVIARKCDACEGLTMSGEHIIENTVAGSVARDTGIILSALKVENFEITAYKGLIQLAKSLDKNDIGDLLQETLNEEAEASDLLTDILQTEMEQPA